MCFSIRIILAISCLAPSLAAPPLLAKRAYITELKASMVHIDQSWKKIENDFKALPTVGATVDDFKGAQSALDGFTNYMRSEYEVAIERNGPFTNTKWSDEFLQDMKPYQLNAVRAMSTLKTYAPEINGL
ncbi:hypothetical protein H1R20_g11928, partial [Candolleomyces eurysporus]